MVVFELMYVFADDDIHETDVEDINYEMGKLMTFGIALIITKSLVFPQIYRLF